MTARYSERYNEGFRARSAKTGRYLVVTKPVTQCNAVSACPHCGQPMPSDQVPAALPYRSRRIYEAIRDAGPEGISSLRIAEIVYADDPDGGPASNSVSVLIKQQINPRIEPFGLVIVGWRGPGSVYVLRRIDDEERPRRSRRTRHKADAPATGQRSPGGKG